MVPVINVVPNGLSISRLESHVAVVRGVETLHFNIGRIGMKQSRHPVPDLERQILPPGRKGEAGAGPAQIEHHLKALNYMNIYSTPGWPGPC
jgi:hypothetical protein